MLKCIFISMFSLSHEHRTKTKARYVFQSRYHEKITYKRSTIKDTAQVEHNNYEPPIRFSGGTSKEFLARKSMQKEGNEKHNVGIRSGEICLGVNDNQLKLLHSKCLDVCVPLYKRARGASYGAIYKGNDVNYLGLDVDGQLYMKEHFLFYLLSFHPYIQSFENTFKHLRIHTFKRLRMFWNKNALSRALSEVNFSLCLSKQNFKSWNILVIAPFKIILSKSIQLFKNSTKFPSVKVFRVERLLKYVASCHLRSDSSNIKNYFRNF